MLELCMLSDMDGQTELALPVFKSERNITCGDCCNCQGVAILGFVLLKQRSPDREQTRSQVHCFLFLAFSEVPMPKNGVGSARSPDTFSENTASQPIEAAQITHRLHSKWAFSRLIEIHCPPRACIVSEHIAAKDALCLPSHCKKVLDQIAMFRMTQKTNNSTMRQ